MLVIPTPGGPWKHKNNMSGYLTCLFKALAMDLLCWFYQLLGTMETQDVMSGYLTCLFKALAMDLAMLVLPTPGDHGNTRCYVWLYYLPI